MVIFNILLFSAPLSVHFIVTFVGCVAVTVTLFVPLFSIFANVFPSFSVTVTGEVYSIFAVISPFVLYKVDIVTFGPSARSVTVTGIVHVLPNISSPSTSYVPFEYIGR